MIAGSSKRPFAVEVPQGSTVIDLTSDNDDGPPPKRQRSESYPAPKISPTTKTLTTDATTPSVHNNINGLSLKLSKSTLSNGNSLRHANKEYYTRSNALSDVTSVVSGHLKIEKNGTVNSLPASNHIRTSTSPKTVPRHNLSNGKNSFPIRSSPIPPQHLTVTAPRPKSSRSPEVIDLDTDSDRASKKPKPAPTQYGLISANGISAKPEKSKSPNFVLPTTQPIRFDPTNRQWSASSLARNSSIPRVETYSSYQPSKPGPKLEVGQVRKNEPVRKPVVRVNVPPTISQQQEVIRKLKGNVDYVEKNPDHVLEVTGVRHLASKDLTEELHKKVRQKKYQPPVDRSKVLLDFGTEMESPITTGKVRFISPRKQTRSILDKRFENESLNFENNVNDRRVNGKFQFISDYVFSRKVQARSQTPHPLRSCSCMEYHELCAPDCPCLVSQLTTKVDDIDVTRRVNTYQYHPDDPSLVILSDALIEDKTHTAKIFECGDSCRCPKECINRVVKRGRTIPLQIFETGKYGFGVRSSKRILRGQFIDIYLGEVLTEGEVSKREAAAEEDTPSYIMSLDAFITDEKAMFYIDGENFGSVTRFVNHSCEPNCKIIPVVLPKGTKHLYYVAFFAIKDIEVGEELTIDYDPDLLDEDEEGIVDDGVVRCQCGSAKCRRRLWAPGKEKRGRRKKYLPSRDDD